MADRLALVRDDARSCGAKRSPSEILLLRAPQDRTDPDWHFFRATVRYDQERAAIAFPSHLPGRPIADADRGARSIAERSTRKAEGAASRPMSNSLRRLLRMEIIQNPPSGRDAARHRTDRRPTLSHRLRAEGTSFRTVATQIRFKTAQQQLGDINMALAQISACLGSSEATAFPHAFRRWSGKTLSILRPGCRPPETATDPRPVVLSRFDENSH